MTKISIIHVAFEFFRGRYLRQPIQADKLASEARGAAVLADPAAAAAHLFRLGNQGDNAVRRQKGNTDEQLLIVADGIMTEMIRRAHSSRIPFELREPFRQLAASMSALQLKMRESYVYDLGAAVQFADELGGSWTA